MKRVFVIALMVCLWISSSPAYGEGDWPMKIISYARTWPLGDEVAQMRRGAYWKAEDIRGEYLHTLNIAFGVLDPKREYRIEVKDARASGVMEEVQRLKEAYPHLKVNLSVGGWGADHFSCMAQTKESRGVFIEDAKEFLVRHNLDGIDIDWEYPVGPPWGGLPIVTRPEDGKNYGDLLRELRAALDALSLEREKDYSLTVAVPASAWFLDAVDILDVARSVHYLKLMTYDFYGGWSLTTGHGANLYNNPQDPAWGGWSCDQTVQAYLERGVKPEQLILGVPFYGTSWQGVEQGETEGLFMATKGSAFPRVLSGGNMGHDYIQALRKRDPSFVRYWDSTAQAPFLYNGSIWITYEDEESLGYKVAYAKERGLGGIMIWEYAHDVEAELLKHLYQCIME